MENKNGSSSVQYLEKFAVNLNERAAQGKLDPVIGRDEEIRRVLQILSREYSSVSKSPPAFPEAGSSLFSSYQHDAGKMSALTVVPVSTRLNRRKILFQNAAKKFSFVKILFS